eukprot:gene13521-14870_t
MFFMHFCCISLVFFVLSGLTIFAHSTRFFEYYARDIEKEGKCKEYYSYSSFPGWGRGMYAGKDYLIDDIVGDVNPSITVPREKMMGTQIIYYEFGYDNDSSIIVLGPGSLHNHNETYHVIHTWADITVEEPRDSLRSFEHSAYLFDLFQAQSDILEGEEILFFYGENWFSSKDFNISENETAEEELSIDGGTTDLLPNQSSLTAPLPAICMSDVEVAPSFLPPYQINSDTDEGVFVSPGYGLFAKRAFKQGELILAVPLLFLPAEVIESLEEHESEIVSYSLYEEGSRVYLVPMGVGVMMNHYRSLTSIIDGSKGDERGEGEDESRSEGAANVNLQWFDFWEHFPCATDGSGECSFPRNNVPYALQSMLSKSVEELLEMKMAPLDIGYYAARDIEAGEELLIDYGEGWEEYMREFLQGQEVVEELMGEEEREDKEDFRREYIRHPIGLGKGSMPEHWLGHVRDNDDNDNEKNNIVILLNTFISKGFQLFHFYISPLFSL